MPIEFLLKKFVSLFLMPLPFGMLVLLIGAVFLFKNHLKKAKFFLSLGIVWLFLCSYSPLVNRLLHPIESYYPTLHHAPQNVEYIYVLGTGHTTDETLPITSQVSYIGLTRLSEGIRLYHQLKEKPYIIVSGYNGLFDPTSHAQMQQKLALALGVDEAHIIVCPHPIDTQEEAIEAKRIIGEKPFIVVSSASHLLRSMRFFEQEGLYPTPAPTQHLSSLKNPNYFDIFSSEALDHSQTLLHELLGLLWQSVKGD